MISTRIFRTIVTASFVFAAVVLYVHFGLPASSIEKPTGKPRILHVRPPIVPKPAVPIYRGEHLPPASIELPDPASIEATIAVAPDSAGELVQLILRQRRQPTFFPELRQRRTWSIETVDPAQASLVTVVPNPVPLIRPELRFGFGQTITFGSGKLDLVATASVLNVRGLHIGAAVSSSLDVGPQINLEALPRLHVTGAWWLRRNRPAVGLSYNL